MTTFSKLLQFTQHRQAESILLHSGMIKVNPLEILNILEELSSHIILQGLFKISKVLSVEEVTKRLLQYFETEHLPKEKMSNMEYLFSLHARFIIDLYPFKLSPIDNLFRI